MKEIYVGFSSPKAWKIGAEAIQMWMHKPYSHVFVCWKSDKISRVLVYHAAHGSVHFNSIARLQEDNEIVALYKLSISDDQYTALLQKCIDLAGVDYGYVELLKILVKDTCDSLGFQCKMVENSRGYICSELLAELLIGLGATFERPTFLLRPDHIEQGLAQLNANRADLKELQI